MNHVHSGNATARKTMTLDQQRAEYAWKVTADCVERTQKEYVNLCKSAPALVMNNGLLQTLAFFNQKSGKDSSHELLAIQIRCWLSMRLGWGPQDEGFSRFMEKMLILEAGSYRQAVAETLALLRWIRQFAAARNLGE